MLNDYKVPNGVAVVVASYLKRIMEGQYDKLSEIPAFEKLKAQSPVVKYGLEASLYALTTLLDQYIKEDTVIKKTLKEVGLDFASEFSKRLMNGDQLKDGLNSSQDGSNNISEKDLFRIISGLGEEDILEFLNWIESTTPEERKNVFRNISMLSAEDIQKLWNLKPEARQKLLKFTVQPSNKKSL